MVVFVLALFLSRLLSYKAYAAQLGNEQINSSLSTFITPSQLKLASSPPFPSSMRFIISTSSSINTENHFNLFMP